MADLKSTMATFKKECVLSQNTIKKYNREYKKYIIFCKDQFKINNERKILKNENFFQKYIKMNKNKYKPLHFFVIYSAIKKIAYVVFDESVNYPRCIMLMKDLVKTDTKPTKKAKEFTLEHVQQYFISRKMSNQDIRNLSILTVGIFTGMRINELTMLEIENIKIMEKKEVLITMPKKNSKNNRKNQWIVSNKYIFPTFKFTFAGLLINWLKILQKFNIHTGRVWRIISKN